MDLPPSDTARLVLLRHGETTWSAAGKHTGRTDLPLTAAGEREARGARHRLGDLDPAAVYTSPLLRARRTAELAGFADAVVDPDLAEWDYGPVEGRTSAEISEVIGREFDIFREGVGVLPAGPAGSAPDGGTPGGEELAEVRARADRFVARARPTLDDGGTVLVVAHGHLLRVLATAWLDVDPAFGARLELGTAAICALGTSHGLESIEAWNLVAG
ncbi:putative phosphoglycerate mutase [Isoptericola sp. CG 20/1183]|uniref:Phosphoglycerate mutase n=1 Tax=Isoptericola halotolerans TaxID=300560 RepID=A0ABX5EL61_9MICO|nr:MULTISPECIES: histidine phosphatase family protein [Isoptericola]PRZ04116.1 putative phosphoglycerate mutase [Isoptericola sp. CG 20/1183]PRZ10059.1 putative phosphoglycerate mutase [Isoptericola halotolerans]